MDTERLSPYEEEINRQREVDSSALSNRAEGAVELGRIRGPAINPRGQRRGQLPVSVDLVPDGGEVVLGAGLRACICEEIPTPLPGVTASLNVAGRQPLCKPNPGGQRQRVGPFPRRRGPRPSPWSNHTTTDAPVVWDRDRQRLCGIALRQLRRGWTWGDNSTEPADERIHWEAIPGIEDETWLQGVTSR